eukprot:Platyproteum_vivax@DN4710_c0_g1_i1.p1
MSGLKKPKKSSKIIKPHEVFVFDMDGVLWEGDKVVAGARECLTGLAALNKQVFFATNNSLYSPTEYVKIFNKKGFENIREEQMYCTMQVTKDYLQHIGFQGKLYVIASQSFKDEIAKVPGVEVFDNREHLHIIVPRPQLDMQVDPDISGVIIGFCVYFNYFQMAYASLVLQKPKTVFLATNRDLSYPTKGQLYPGTGSWVVALESACNREADTIGKPAVFALEAISKKTNVTTNKICMVGDNLLTDIPFANDANSTSLLVETGVDKETDAVSAPPGRQPHFILPSIHNLYMACCQGKL